MTSIFLSQTTHSWLTSKASYCYPMPTPSLEEQGCPTSSLRRGQSLCIAGGDGVE